MAHTLNPIMISSKINIVYSTQHWIFPIITLAVLLILGVIMFIVEGRKRVKEGGKWFEKPGRFFEENYDKKKFWGTIIITAIYFFLLDKVGFSLTSIIYLFAMFALYAGKEQIRKPRYHVNSAIISVVSVLIVSFFFGVVFNISLPSGFASIWIKSLGITIY